MAEQKADNIVVMRLIRFNAIIVALTTALVFGLAIFVATIWLVVKGGEVVGPHLGLLGQFLIGYQVTVAGSLIGLAYGLGLGFVVGYCVARLYNGIVDWKEDRRRARG